MIGLDGKPYLKYDNVDTTYITNNNLRIIKSICNSTEFDTWGVTGQPGGCHYDYDEKHAKLYHHSNTVEFDTSDVLNKQLFEQLYFKIYNTGMQIPLKKPAVGWTSNWQHFDYMEDFFNGLPFSEIKGIYIIVQPAGTETLVHSDLNSSHAKAGDRFIYIRPDLSKDFFVYNDKTKEKHVTDHLAIEFNWYDYHGAEHNDYSTYAFKVVGTLL